MGYPRNLARCHLRRLVVLFEQRRKPHHIAANPMTNVYNPDIPDFCAAYSLSPDQAVIAAYEQFGKWPRPGNKNTWAYRSPEQHPGYKRTAHGHYCNGFWAKACQPT